MINLTSGRSRADSITFYTPKSEVTATRMENGKISIKREQRLSYMKDFSNFTYILGTIILCLVSLLEIPTLIALFKKLNFLNIWYLSIITIYAVWLIYVTIAAHSSRPTIENHAAEHMVYTAYKKLKRIPTFDEATKFSRFSNNCGIMTYSALLTGAIFSYVLYIFLDITIPQLMILFLAPCLARVFPFNLPGFIAQIFTTKKAKKENIEPAIMALHALEVFEENNPES